MRVCPSAFPWISSAQLRSHWEKFNCVAGFILFKYALVDCPTEIQLEAELQERMFPACYHVDTEPCGATKA